VRLTQGDGWHNTAFARNGEVFVDTYSNRTRRRKSASAVLTAA
jgi:hypothetical protein